MGALALQLLGAALVAVQLLSIRALLAGLASPPATAGFAHILPTLAILVVAAAAASVLASLRTELQRPAAEMVRHHAERRVAEVASRVDLLAFDQPAFHDRLEAARVSAETRPYLAAIGVLGLLNAVLGIATISLVVALLQPLLLLLLVAASVPLWLAVLSSARLGHRFARALLPADRRRRYIFELLTDRQAAAELRSLGVAAFLLGGFDGLYAERIGALRRLAAERMRVLAPAGLLAYALSGCVLLGLAYLIVSSRSSLAVAGTVAVAVFFLGQRVSELSLTFGALLESTHWVEEYKAFVRDQPVQVERSGQWSARQLSTLSLRQVSFSYPGSEQPALREVSLEIRRGELVALVGENGSGKTTLAKLLSGLYVPSAGLVLADGQALDAGGRAELMASTAFMFQDFQRFLLSATDNIAAGRPASGASLAEAAERSGAASFLEALPRGYETLLGPQLAGGVDLSAGQWQRVALARALHRDAELLILDEPTSALDPAAEIELMATVRRLYRERLAVLISHRFSTVRDADRIVVLRAGTVLEQGSHAELMRRRGLYHELFTAQAAAYAD